MVEIHAKETVTENAHYEVELHAEHKLGRFPKDECNLRNEPDCGLEEKKQMKEGHSQTTPSDSRQVNLRHMIRRIKLEKRGKGR